MNTDLKADPMLWPACGNCRKKLTPKPETLAELEKDNQEIQECLIIPYRPEKYRSTDGREFDKMAIVQGRQEILDTALNPPP